MSLTFDEISEAAMHLPADSRADLAERLVASLHDTAESEAQWKEELMRRCDDISSGRVQTIAGEEVTAEVRAIVGL